MLPVLSIDFEHTLPQPGCGGGAPSAFFQASGGRDRADNDPGVSAFFHPPSKGGTYLGITGGRSAHIPSSLGEIFRTPPELSRANSVIPNALPFISLSRQSFYDNVYPVFQIASLKELARLIKRNRPPHDRNSHR